MRGVTLANREEMERHLLARCLKRMIVKFNYRRVKDQLVAGQARRVVLLKLLVWFLRQNVVQAAADRQVLLFKKRVVFGGWRNGLKALCVKDKQSQVASEFHQRRSRQRLIGKCFQALRLAWYKG